MSGLTGSFAELDALIAYTAALETVTERVAQKVAPKIEALCRKNYADQKGPDGTAWKRNKDGTYPSLARPAGNVFFKAEGSTIIGVAEDLLRYHQTGSRDGKLPKRAVFPEEGTIPANWQVVIDKEMAAEIEKVS
jgi:hypothetical protein